MGSISVNVLDLPHLRDKPSFQVLVETLKALTLNPSTWSDSAFDSSTPEDPIATSRYLTFILKNPFDWFEDAADVDSNEQREMVWNLASQRLSERCGRTAMGEISRSWVIPEFRERPALKLEIREPPLTGDNLGLKTWGTAWAIAQKLDMIGAKYFSHLLKCNLGTFNTTTSDSNTHSQTRILELGAGTGLLGLAAAAMWSTDIVLTDMEVIRENLLFNIDKNMDLLESRGAKVIGDVLDWTEPEKGLTKCFNKQFEIVLASDPLYDDSHPELVAKMIKQHLKLASSSRAMVAVPLRDKKTAEFALKLQDIMLSYNFQLLHEGTEVCRDDWATKGGENNRARKTESVQAVEEIFRQIILGAGESRTVSLLRIPLPKSSSQTFSQRSTFDPSVVQGRRALFYIPETKRDGSYGLDALDILTLEPLSELWLFFPISTPRCHSTHHSEDTNLRFDLLSWIHDLDSVNNSLASGEPKILAKPFKPPSGIITEDYRPNLDNKTSTSPRMVGVKQWSDERVLFVAQMREQRFNYDAIVEACKAQWPRSQHKFTVNSIKYGILQYKERLPRFLSEGKVQNAQAVNMQSAPPVAGPQYPGNDGSSGNVTVNRTANKNYGQHSSPTPQAYGGQAQSHQTTANAGLSIITGYPANPYKTEASSRLVAPQNAVNGQSANGMPIEEQPGLVNEDNAEEELAENIDNQVTGSSPDDDGNLNQRDHGSDTSEDGSDDGLISQEVALAAQLAHQEAQQEIQRMQQERMTQTANQEVPRFTPLPPTGAPRSQAPRQNPPAMGKIAGQQRAQPPSHPPMVMDPRQQQHYIQQMRHQNQPPPQIQEQYFGPPQNFNMHAQMQAPQMMPQFGPGQPINAAYNHHQQMMQNGYAMVPNALSQMYMGGRMAAPPAGYPPHMPNQFYQPQQGPQHQPVFHGHGHPSAMPPPQAPQQQSPQFSLPRPSPGPRSRAVSAGRASNPQTPQENNFAPSNAAIQQQNQRPVPQSQRVPAGRTSNPPIPQPNSPVFNEPMLQQAQQQHSSGRQRAGSSTNNNSVVEPNLMLQSAFTPSESISSPLTSTPTSSIPMPVADQSAEKLKQKRNRKKETPATSTPANIPVPESQGAIQNSDSQSKVKDGVLEVFSPVFETRFVAPSSSSGWTTFARIMQNQGASPIGSFASFQNKDGVTIKFINPVFKAGFEFPDSSGPSAPVAGGAPMTPASSGQGMTPVSQNSSFQAGRALSMPRRQEPDTPTPQGRIRPGPASTAYQQGRATPLQESASQLPSSSPQIGTKRRMAGNTEGVGNSAKKQKVGTNAAVPRPSVVASAPISPALFQTLAPVAHATSQQTLPNDAERSSSTPATPATAQQTLSTFAENSLAMGQGSSQPTPNIGEPSQPIPVSANPPTTAAEQSSSALAPAPAAALEDPSFEDLFGNVENSDIDRFFDNSSFDYQGLFGDNYIDPNPHSSDPTVNDPSDPFFGEQSRLDRFSWQELSNNQQYAPLPESSNASKPNAEVVSNANTALVGTEVSNLHKESDMTQSLDSAEKASAQTPEEGPQLANVNNIENFDAESPVLHTAEPDNSIKAESQEQNTSIFGYDDDDNDIWAALTGMEPEPNPNANAFLTLEEDDNGMIVPPVPVPQSNQAHYIPPLRAYHQNNNSSAPAQHTTSSGHPQFLMNDLARSEEAWVRCEEAADPSNAWKANMNKRFGI
ncbi:hypothetical protein G7Y89_g8684 [Cudoniella acicularis]|uniref:Uncharacterized protein n=1 Tax=Cudoniella acicularis TaxID=354080 RepID=A0A8H4RHQ8_9HELO|nr:hypothetical protein G7Y89_g8684 [Cudoniella acicularis]